MFRIDTKWESVQKKEWNIMSVSSAGKDPFDKLTNNKNISPNVKEALKELATLLKEDPGQTVFSVLGSTTRRAQMQKELNQSFDDTKLSQKESEWNDTINDIIEKFEQKWALPPLPKEEFFNHSKSQEYMTKLNVKFENIKSAIKMSQAKTILDNEGISLTDTQESTEILSDKIESWTKKIQSFDPNWKDYPQASLEERHYRIKNWITKTNIALKKLEPTPPNIPKNNVNIDDTFKAYENISEGQTKTSKNLLKRFVGMSGKKSVSGIKIPAITQKKSIDGITVFSEEELKKIEDKLETYNTPSLQHKFKLPSDSSTLEDRNNNMHDWLEKNFNTTPIMSYGKLNFKSVDELLGSIEKILKENGINPIEDSGEPPNG